MKKVILISIVLFSVLSFFLTQNAALNPDNTLSNLKSAWAEDENPCDNGATPAYDAHECEDANGNCFCLANTDPDDNPICCCAD